MKTFSSLLFVFFTLFVHAQSPVINNGRGLYHIIPNSIVFDTSLFSILPHEGMEEENGKYFITSNEPQIEIIFQHKKDKADKAFTYSIKKPILTGIYFGKYPNRSCIMANEFNPNDKIRMEFDVDTFLGKNWCKLVSANESLYKRESMYFSTYNDSVSLKYVIKNTSPQTRMTYYLSNMVINVQNTRNIDTEIEYSIVLNASRDTSDLEYYFTRPYNALHFLSSNLLFRIGIQNTTMKLSSREKNYRHIVIKDYAGLDSIYKADTTAKYEIKYTKKYAIKPVAKLMINSGKKTLTIHQKNKIRSITQDEDATLTHTSMVDDYSIQYFFHHGNSILIMSEKYMMENKNFGIINDMVFEDLKHFEFMHLTLDSIVIKRKDTKVATLQMAVKKYNPCGNIDCEEIYGRTTLFLSDNCIIYDPIQFEKLKQKKRKTMRKQAL